MASDLSPGSTIRVKDGTNAPDLPEYSIGGWSGTITQVSGKKGAKKVFIEWDDATLTAMSDGYQQACEEKSQRDRTGQDDQGRGEQSRPYFRELRVGRGQ